MKKYSLLILTAMFVSLLTMAAPAAASLEKYVFEASWGGVLEIAARSFQPGEPILVTLSPAGGITRAKIVFLGKTLILKPDGSGRPTVGCLGIDLGVKPGPYAIEIIFTRKTGKGEESVREFQVLDRRFPETKLTFAAKYVTPPPEVKERIRKESELVSEIYGGMTPAWLGDGRFILPHKGKSWGNFGQRRLNNNILSSVHGGLDIRALPGDEIHASNSGRVALASDLYMSGKTVIIDHGMGIYSTYCHLSKLLVRRGQTVVKGGTLGSCGSTGRSTGPHLHWGFRVPGGRVDPDGMSELPFPAAGSNPGDGPNQAK